MAEKQYAGPRMALRRPASLPIRLFGAFALLVGHCAGSLAGGLTGRLSFATAALFQAFFQAGRSNGLDMLHGASSLESAAILPRVFFISYHQFAEM